MAPEPHARPVAKPFRIPRTLTALRAFTDRNAPNLTATAMLRLIGFFYTVGIWGTFAILVYGHWDQCVGIGGCATRLATDFVLGVVWPFFWGGWLR